jgi:transcriptional regulator with XRE-family HTH domain
VDRKRTLDDALYTGDLDLASVTTPEELTALLRIVHLRADKPSLRDLQAKTRHRATPLSKTVVSEMLRGIRNPRRAVMVSFLLACGVQDDHIEPWLRAWERIATRQPTPVQNKATYVPSGGHARVAADVAGFSDSSVPLQEADCVAQGLNASAAVPTKIAVAAENSNTVQLRDEINQPSADNTRLELDLAVSDRQSTGQQADHASAANARTTRSPTVSRRELGALLRTLRTEQGLTVEQVAERLLCSPSKVSRMETGHGIATPRDIRDLCDLYEVTDQAERDRMMQLSREGKRHGWWQSYGLPYSTYVGLEMEALSISDFQSSVVPGLLQTADYARAGHEGAMPRLSAEDIERRIEARLTRQALLIQSAPPSFKVVLDEAVLHRAVGGPQVMRAQLERLIEAAQLPNVTLQVIPFDVGAHPGMESNFNILDLQAPASGIVYVEGLVGSIYLERPEEVERYRGVFERLQEIALSPKDTIDAVARVRDQLIR